MAENRGKKIFIVDDDVFLLDMYAARFIDAAYNVETATSGLLALEKINAGLAPDVMLLDVVMPAMDGFELLEQVTKEKLLPNTLTIYLSNLGQNEDLQKGKSLGAIGYIIKATSTPSEVVAEVEEIISKHHGL